MDKMTELEKKRLGELSDEWGFFRSKYPGDWIKGVVTIGYLDELNEFIYLNPNITATKKLSSIRIIEAEIINAIKSNCQYKSNFFLPNMWSNLIISQN